mgnify:CR=1 FL=1
MKLTKEEIEQLETRYKVSFINSLAGYRQAVLIGTKSEKGHTNLAIFNSLIHLGANPPLYGLVSRPDTVRRDTLNNILNTKSYTLNYVSSEYVEKAHQVSAKYEEHVSEFNEVGFTEEYLGKCKVPFVKEAVVKIQMELKDKIDIEINGTILLIGSIESIQINDDLVDKDGFVELHKEEVLACSGLDAYFQPQFIGRLGYARPNQELTFLKK